MPIIVLALLLQNALDQQGPWSKKELRVDNQWVMDTLTQKIKNIDWQSAKSDVLNFVKPKERHSVELWDKGFFLHFVNEMKKYLK